jgi:hypothetical protein
MHPVAQFLSLAGGLLAAAVVVLVAIASKGPDPCEDAKTLKTSPTGKYEAEMTMHTCGWGFGQAAETVDVKITKLGSGGWFTHVPIEYDSTAEDQGTPPPTVQWTDPDSLIIEVNSKVRTGNLVSMQLGLTVVRKYNKL